MSSEGNSKRDAKFPQHESGGPESSNMEIGSVTSILSINNGDWRAPEGLEEWNINLKELFVGKKFAAGTYGRLYLGFYRNEKVAIKILNSVNNDAIEVENLSKQFKQEISMLSKLQHPNIVKFIGASQNPPVWLIVTELLSGGNLKKFLEGDDSKTPLKKSVSMALDVSRAIRHLHSKDIIHRDLKPENLVFSEDGRLKLTDFGISRSENASAEMTAEAGTFRWMAPEVMDAKHYTRTVDVYSFGILFWQFITQKIPFEDMTPVQVAFGVAMKNARPEIPKTCPPALSILMQQCWNGNPKKRPDFQHIVFVLSHFLKELEEKEDGVDRDDKSSASTSVDGRSGDLSTIDNDGKYEYSNHDPDACAYCKEIFSISGSSQEKPKKKKIFSSLMKSFKKLI